MFNVLLHLSFHQLRYKRSTTKAFGSKGSIRSGPEFKSFIHCQIWTTGLVLRITFTGILWPISMWEGRKGRSLIQYYLGQESCAQWTICSKDLGLTWNLCVFYEKDGLSYSQRNQFLPGKVMMRLVIYLRGSQTGSRDYFHKNYLGVLEKNRFHS